MAEIHHPRLTVERVPDQPGERRLVVSYEIAVGSEDPLIGSVVSESVVVRAHDLHDAPVAPNRLDVRFFGQVPVDGAGRIPRRLERQVHRVLLDVEADWWRTGQAGEVEPIGEFEDHLVAEIRIAQDDHEVARARTPMVSGSWGALGSD
jgi:hypothetical protein